MAGLAISAFNFCVGCSAPVIRRASACYDAHRRSYTEAELEPMSRAHPSQTMCYGRSIAVAIHYGLLITERGPHVRSPVPYRLSELAIRPMRSFMCFVSMAGDTTVNKICHADQQER